MFIRGFQSAAYSRILTLSVAKVRTKSYFSWVVPLVIIHSALVDLRLTVQLLPINVKGRQEGEGGGREREKGGGTAGSGPATGRLPEPGSIEPNSGDTTSFSV